MNFSMLVNTLVFMATSTILSALSFADTCDQYTAKIYANVKNLESQEGPQNFFSCAYQLEIDSLQEPNVCGISYKEAEQAWLTSEAVGDSSCGLKNGQNLKGTLVRKGNVYWLQN